LKILNNQDISFVEEGWMDIILCWKSVWVCLWIGCCIVSKDGQKLTLYYQPFF